MKSLLLLPAIILFFFSCSTEELNQEITADIVVEKNIDTRDFNINCATYKPRVNRQGFIPIKIYRINYSNTLTLDQITCLRMEYFEVFQCLYMSPYQDLDPYTDTWHLFPCWPDGSEEIDESIDEDDRLDD